MQIINSNPNDIPEIFRLYNLVIDYQKERFTVYWPKFELSLVETEIIENRQWKIVINNEVACVFATTFYDPLIWEEKNKDPAVYIHRIATNPHYRGKKFVEHIVEWVKQYAKENNKNFIRLDTVGDNKKLIDHYCKCGFTFLGLVDLPDRQGLPQHYQTDDVCLFEIALQ